VTVPLVTLAYVFGVGFDQSRLVGVYVERVWHKCGSC